MLDAESSTERINRIWFVTGGSTGIGAATVRMAIEAGDRVAVTARSTSKLAELVSTYGSHRVLALPCDVTDWDAQRDAVARALAWQGRLDVVMANAGVAIGSSFLGGDDTPEAWREMILTNIFGAAATVRLTLPALVESRGHLLLTGSVAGRSTSASSLYAATKWSVTGMAQMIRNQIVGTGVRVSLIAPGVVETPLWGGSSPTGMPALQPEDVARAVLYAVNQPERVDVNEILVRPTGQPII
jgi:NADP-dependent 3-hydroxy acid dehydrogenase YdfG